jgi:hypothetical protein
MREWAEPALTSLDIFACSEGTSLVFYREYISVVMKVINFTGIFEHVITNLALSG